MQVRSLMSIMLTAVVCAGLTAATYAQNGEPDTVIHVDIVNGSTSPPNHGQDGWGGDAYKFLQDALDGAEQLLDDPEINSVDIWVAAGTYRPDQGDGITAGDVTQSFELLENVAILGGFKGYEENEFERDPETNVTILSGDLAGDDIIDDTGPIPYEFHNDCDNSHHVVTAAGVGDTAVLDGFVIQGGQTAGLIATDARPRVFNCVFMPSTCAAVHLRGDSSVVFVDCEFAGSDASAVVIDAEARGYFVDRRRGTVTERAGGE